MQIKSKRVENKYIFKPNYKYKVINEILNRGYIEIFQERVIKSVYFDTKNLKCYSDSVEGNIPRKKIRVRSYDDFISDLTLEEKEVNTSGRFKKAKKISSVPYKIIDNGYGILYPVIEIIYKRKYFSNKLIRLTLDYEVEYKSLNSGIVAKSDSLILESKLSDNILYNEETNNFKIFGLNNVSFSKYKEGINLSTFFTID